MSKTVNVTPQVNFLGFLTLIFITLKLCNVINWSWVWVLSPFWIPLALFVLAMVCCVVVFMLVSILYYFRKRKNRFL